MLLYFRAYLQTSLSSLSNSWPTLFHRNIVTSIPRLDLSDLHTRTNKNHARLYFALNSNYEDTQRYRENRGPKLRIRRNGFRFSRSTTGIYLLVHGSVYPRVCATDVCLLVNICISMVNTTSYAVHDFRLTSCLMRLLLQTRFQISIAWNRNPGPSSTTTTTRMA